MLMLKEKRLWRLTNLLSKLNVILGLGRTSVVLNFPKSKKEQNIDANITYTLIQWYIQDQPPHSGEITYPTMHVLVMDYF